MESCYSINSNNPLKLYLCAKGMKITFVLKIDGKVLKTPSISERSREELKNKAEIYRREKSWYFFLWGLTVFVLEISKLEVSVLKLPCNVSDENGLSCMQEKSSFRISTSSWNSSEDIPDCSSISYPEHCWLQVYHLPCCMLNFHIQQFSTVQMIISEHDSQTWFDVSVVEEGLQGSLWKIHFKINLTRKSWKKPIKLCTEKYSLQS